MSTQMQSTPPFLGPKPRELKQVVENIVLKKLIEKNEAFLKSIGDNPMYDATIEKIDGRKIKINGHWLIDFASCNYLGFDLDKEIMDAVPEYISKWGTHPSWSRLLGNPILYEELEEKYTRLVGAEDSIALPNLTLISMYSIFVLSEGGEIFLDKFSHRTLYEGASLARAFGSKLTYFKSDDLGQLELLLQMSTSHKKLICVDGVFSMHGKYADIPKLVQLAKQYDALLYIDDAHGFGVIGERGEDELSPYGKKGNSIIRHFGQDYDRIVLVTALSKAYSSYGAMMSCSKELKRYFKAVLSPYLYSGPVPIASLATAIKGLEVNEKRGDQIRAKLHQKCLMLSKAIARLGFRTDNSTDFPIYNFYLKEPDKVDFMSRFLFDRGIYVTLCPYPMVSRNDVGFRVQLTAANTDDEIDYLIRILEELPNHMEIQMEKLPA